MAQKKFSSSPQSSGETKPNTKLVLVTWEPLLSKPNKQNVYEIDLFNKFNFSQWQKILDTLIDVKECEKSKHYFLKSDKHITLLSEANVPVQFTAQLQAKYSSQQLTANCIAAKRCHRPQRTQICTVTNAPFRSKLESNGLQVDRNRKFSERIFQLLQYSRQHPSFSAHWADLMTKTDSTFPGFSFRIVDFAVHFLLRCKFSFQEKWHSSQVWQWRDLPKPITILCQCIATNGIASFCIDHRWRQMAFFVFCQDREAPLSRALREIKQLLVCEQSLFLYYIKQIDSMLPCICPVIDYRGRQNSGKNISDTLGYLLVCHFFVLTTFWRHLWFITGQMHGNMESIC